MVITTYYPSAFEQIMGYVFIIAVIVVISVYHISLVRKILESNRTGKIKRIIGMVAIASIFWLLSVIPLMMGIVNIANYGFAMSTPMFFVIPVTAYLLGAFFLCLGSGVGYSIAFSDKI